MDTTERLYEIAKKPQISQVKCVVLDYDGTLTTLRKGWDKILSKYARQKINPGSSKTIPELEKRIRHLTDHAGGTTPKQLMSRLLKLIEDFGFVPKKDIKSIDDYALEYSVIFQSAIDKRLENFHEHSESYVIHGVRPMLNFLRSQQTLNYVVTGSATNAVSNELVKLEMENHFIDVYGASLETVGNLKEDAIKEIMARHKLANSEILIIGDGSTEMRAAKRLELPTIGIASDEHKGGLCRYKREMLLDLGAHIIIPDYTDFITLWDTLHN